MLLLGKRIKELRTKHSMTQQQLGNAINVTKVSICCYENGTRTPTLDTLTKLGKVLDVDVDYLLGYDSPVKEKGKSKKVINMAKEEIEFITEIRKLENIHQAIIENPKRIIELISKELNS